MLLELETKDWMRDENKKNVMFFKVEEDEEADKRAGDMILGRQYMLCGKCDKQHLPDGHGMVCGIFAVCADALFSKLESLAEKSGLTALMLCAA